jgi:hypothetical protein
MTNLKPGSVVHNRYVSFRDSNLAIRIAKQVHQEMAKYNVFDD